jgi:hypothetical protein
MTRALVFLFIIAESVFGCRRLLREAGERRLMKKIVDPVATEGR